MPIKAKTKAKIEIINAAISIMGLYFMYEEISFCLGNISFQFCSSGR